ncbi:phage tail protein I [Salinicola sp. RZ23]|uniref:phage tail protein I n=1 Tax=Salinicola sp. RZ23 TaxID=1949087 RepID=UPI000DA1D20D|nr:phage tail protein I [Salinicola sp. RZ23]
MSQLLPPNRTSLESRTADALVTDPPVPLRTLWNPQTCPAHLLPFLAWAYSVDNWSAAWSERVKRRVIAASFDVHRMKGTRTAIDRALSAMGVDVIIKEWFEVEPNLARGTFDALLYVNENLTPDAPALIGPELYAELRATLDAAKNVRSHYTFRVGARFGPGRLGAATVMTPGGTAYRDAAAGYRTPTLRGGFTAGAATNVRAVGRFSTEATNRAALNPARLLAAATCRAVALTYHIMEPTA